MATVMAQQTSNVHPKKFTLWLGLASIVMMFAGLTSAYIVRHAQGNWLDFQLPKMFWISTAVIVVSSLTIFLAQKAFWSDNRKLYRLWLFVTFLLGISFTYLQYLGWQELMSYGILLEGNPSGSFLYVISGLHALHVAGGVFFLFFVTKNAFKSTNEVEQLMLDMNPDKGLGIDLMSTYWHFIGILWIYLLLFFQYYG